MKNKQEIDLSSIDITGNTYNIRQLRCIKDGSEIKIKEIKQFIENKEIDELWIFSISNKLYKEIIEYLKENGINHTVYGRSRIVIRYL